MSYGGGGLCFLIRIPTEDYENDLLDGRRILITPSPTNGNQSLPSICVNAESEDSTEVKTRVADPLEKVLRKSLDELNISDSLWVLDKDEKFYQVSFTCSPGLPCDLILTSLATNGIGMCRSSSLVVLPCTYWLQDEENSTNSSKEDERKLQFICDEEKKSESESSTISKTKSEVKKAFRSFKDMQRKFLQTVTARLTVAQVVDGVKAGAVPSFDYIMFVLIASMIAALGLIENSSVIIVASMLISPIMDASSNLSMTVPGKEFRIKLQYKVPAKIVFIVQSIITGPILAGTFGAVIRDRALRNLGIKTETLSLFLCVIIGFTIGIVCQVLNGVWNNSRQWPNPEMISRGQERGLWIGVLIALPSGAGVALSVLGGNAGSLVGVAISASLLPPAINTGLLWGMAAVRTIKAHDETSEYVRVEGILRLMKPSLVPPEDYETNYFIEMDKECAVLGLVSLTLALVNIICIFLAALVVLKIKEVAPRTSIARTSRFWKEDIKIARDYNTSMPASEADELGKQFLAEWATLNGLEPDALLSDDAEAAMTRMETLKDIMEDVETDEVFQTVARSVSTSADPRPISKRISVMTTSPNLSVPAVANGDQRRRRGTWAQTLHPTEDKPEDKLKLDPELQDVELRRPKTLSVSPRVQRPSSSRNSVAVLRQSLMNTNNPYTLWPAQKPRFVVTPVPEEPAALSTPSSPTRRRISRFLQDPCVILKETTC